MPAEFTTPDLVELTRAFSEASDIDTTMSFYGEDSVYDMSRMGMGVLRGPAAIRGFLQDWDNQYEEYEDEVLDIVRCGNDVVFLAVRQNARPLGTPQHVRLRDVYGYVLLWTGRTIARITPYTDADEARADAEHLAEE